MGLSKSHNYRDLCDKTQQMEPLHLFCERNWGDPSDSGKDHQHEETCLEGWQGTSTLWGHPGTVFLPRTLWMPPREKQVPEGWQVRAKLCR